VHAQDRLRSRLLLGCATAACRTLRRWWWMTTRRQPAIGPTARAAAPRTARTRARMATAGVRTGLCTLAMTGRGIHGQVHTWLMTHLDRAREFQHLMSWLANLAAGWSL